MLAAGDELERVELGNEMTASTIGADQEAQIDGIAGGSDRVLVDGEPFRKLRGGGGHERACLRWSPRGTVGRGEDVGGVVVEAGEEFAPGRVERMRLLLVARVEFCEIGGVGAFEKRRVGKHVVQFVSGH